MGLWRELGSFELASISISGGSMRTHVILIASKVQPARTRVNKTMREMFVRRYIYLFRIVIIMTNK